MKSAVRFRQPARMPLTRKIGKWMIALSLLTATTVVSLSAFGQNKLTAPSSPTQNVLVVNGSGQPVPTTAQGTTNVAGTVGLAAGSTVNIGNTPTVSVGNTPNVTVANTPTVNLAAGGSVNVTNPPDGQNNPTPLAIMEGAQPYEDDCSILFSGSATGVCNFQAIPSGKRLVIQEFDSIGRIETGLKTLSLVIYSPASRQHYFTTTFQGSDPATDWFAGHQETRLYLPSTTPSCAVTLSGPSTLTFACTFSGFLVDAP